MSGYAFAFGRCVSCRRLFSFGPTRVPSIRVEGRREPLCRDCADALNRRRVAAGLEPFTIDPRAYEPTPEEEL